MRSFARPCLGVLLLLSAAGCQSVAPPTWFAGTAQQQRARAQQFDPYPESDTGPAVDGGRPLEYQRALPETSRARWFSWGR